MEKHYEEIGFLPWPRVQNYLQRGQLWIEEENAEPCGYLIFGKDWPILRIYQAVIQIDAQRREHGLKLVKRLIEKGMKENYIAISLWCADDLESNQFWKSCGFTFAGQRDNGNRRGRKHNRWIFWLSNLIFDETMHDKSLCPNPETRKVSGDEGI